MENVINKKVGSVNNMPHIISLFCGAGGLDLGFKQVGFKVSLAIDSDISSINTHKKNFPETKSFIEDLTLLGPEGVLIRVKEEIPKGTKIGIIGGPPCQGF